MQIITKILQIFGFKKNVETLSIIRQEFFSDTLVEDLMVPKSDIVAIRHDEDFQTICKVFNESEHTRILVYKEDMDDIIGFLHLKDMFKISANKSKFDLSKSLRKLVITTPLKKALDLFNEMRKKRVHIALVVDEYGGTKGLVTIENIIEQQLGAIEDEYDDENEHEDDFIKRQNYFIVSGRLKIKDLEEKINISLYKDHSDHEEDYETITGLIISKLEYLPQVGEKIAIDNKILCTILDASARTIKKIKIQLISE